jgi:hypothetical protein
MNPGAQHQLVPVAGVVTEGGSAVQDPTIVDQRELARFHATPSSR